MPKAQRSAKSKAKPQPGAKALPSSAPSQQAQSGAMSSKAPTQRQQYTIAQKVQLIKDLHAEAKCGLSPRTATDLLRDEDEILRLANELHPEAAK
ncbi:hypothetical protein BG011_003351, partial [Mortierella polycephala]